ncbi:Type I restriction enzyme M protein HdsM [Helicobacter sp. NHP21005]|uniref:HsdM family class I SAM-dependent methyltransferase n=1 Tax=Helicobacter felistomachi TaxID=3040201 RepID=UPI002573EF59|nr:class I SAM-dependent DNA methyltransferase [Helicobacter sp. NHP21005]BEG57358.1 Type I restriction enzyme M protein HdsM [Helicobacter sp. NHP21005]
MPSDALLKLRQDTQRLIDDLKSTCAAYGLGNDGNEYKIIMQLFLYKFLCNKIQVLSNAKYPHKKYEDLSKKEQEIFNLVLTKEKLPKLQPHQFLSSLYTHLNASDIHLQLDQVFEEISKENASLYRAFSTDKSAIDLFEKISPYINEESKRASFTRKVLDSIYNFSFQPAFEEKQGYDFFAPIFEYLLKDYNNAGGGKYAEYYTPLSIAKVMAKILVPNPAKDQKIYDPSAGTGTLLMALAHQIGTSACTLYAQDISQKSLKMLKLNLILNDLTHSIPRVIEGNTLTHPHHLDQKFDYIVSNPPFKLDFSSDHATIKADKNNIFFAGVPAIPKDIKKDGLVRVSDKSKMPIYTLFFQHCLTLLKDDGKCAIVVPTGFISAKNGVENRVLRHIVDKKLVYGVICMPAKVFANTGTNVSIIFFAKQEQEGVVLIDASKMGEKYKDHNKQEKTRLRESEIKDITKVFLHKEATPDFCAYVSHEEIVENGYSLVPGRYFKIGHNLDPISPEEFKERMQKHTQEIKTLFTQSQNLQQEILEMLQGVEVE